VITAFRVLVEYLKESYHLVYLHVCRRIILRQILKEVRYKQFLSHSGRVPAADYHESGNEIPPLYMATNFMTS